jgi:pyruvate dehydrogenase E2 component (dihydrolipoyllysine-residue acetyltransferase)
MAERVTGAKGGTRLQEPTRTQRTVARRSAEARATVPDLDVTVDAEMTRCLREIERHEWSIDAILTRACALALVEVPLANGSYRDGRFELHPRVNVGVTMPTEDAEVLATVFDADGKSVSELTEELEQLAARAQAGELAPPELSGATFALSNLGRYGVRSSTPIVVPGHAAALCAGEVRPVAAVRAGDIVPGHAMTLTLACDHRILFGVQAARFLGHVKSLIEDGSP